MGTALPPDEKLDINFNSLKSVLERAVTYPVSAGDLLKIANDKGADKSIIRWLSSLNPNTRFKDKADVMARAEASTLLRSEIADHGEEIIEVDED